MKRFVIAALLALAAATSVAAAHVKYQGEIEAGYSIGVGRGRSGRINMHTLHGVRLYDFLFAGAGFGLDYCHDGPGDGQLVVPTFVNMKSYLPIFGSIAPYVSVDLGAGFGVTRSLKGMSGFLCGPAAGIQLSRLTVQAGYNLQQLARKNSARLNFNSVQIKVGIMF